MKLIDTSNSIRFGLYVFISLIVFCLAQLTWWIVYQLDLNEEIYQNRIDLLEIKAESMAGRVNNDFGRLSDLAEFAVKSSGGIRTEMERCLNNILSDEAVIGYMILGESPDDIIIGGAVDSTFVYSFGTGNVLYFDPVYPQRIIDKYHPEFYFDITSIVSANGIDWVNPGMFVIRDEVRAEIEGVFQSGSKMFIFEGSFFMLVVLLGAYLIYRTLQRSEDLKTRQVNFTQSVTHEFRTPLTSLRLYLETLDSGKLDSSQSRQLYGKMLDDCDRLDSMVDNILEAGYLGREKYELKLTETGLDRDLGEYLDRLAPFVSRQNGTLDIDIEEHIRIRSDYNSLERAIRALVDNALKYSPPDRRKISVSLVKSGNNAVITISDNGVGIAPAEQRKIFDRYYRVTDSSMRSVNGTGLGLYLVKHIIGAHGGSIEVSSEGADRGTKFVIQLPLVKS